jgi:hypothetical protein
MMHSPLPGRQKSLGDPDERPRIAHEVLEKALRDPQLQMAIQRDVILPPPLATSAVAQSA